VRRGEGGAIGSLNKLKPPLPPGLASKANLKSATYDRKRPLRRESRSLASCDGCTRVAGAIHRLMNEIDPCSSMRHPNAL